MVGVGLDEREPRAVGWAVKGIWISTLAGFASTALTVRVDAPAGGVDPRAWPVLVLLTVVLGVALGVTVGLTWWVTRGIGRGRRWARAVFVGWVAVSFPLRAAALVNGVAPGWVVGVRWGCLLLDLVVVGWLFTRESRGWFSEERASR